MRGTGDDGPTEFVLERRAALLRTACLLTADRGPGEDLVQVALLRSHARWGRARAADPRRLSPRVHTALVLR
ncbi:hypothetical protein [Geodermatophilus sp. SYSU D01119]